MKRPGRQLSEQEALPIIQRLRADYREPSKRGPTWLCFKAEASVSPTIFNSPALDAQPWLYLFFDSIRRRYLEVWVASVPEVRGFFANRMFPDQDVYVFPESMQWCICFPEETNGDEFIVQLGGDVTPFPEVVRCA